MSLTRALHTAHSGLSTAGYRADVAAGNIANANTPGYVRREAVITERIGGNFSDGVYVSAIDRAQDIGISRLRRESDASYGRAIIVSDTYTELNAELGEPGSPFSLFATIETLESSFRDLATTPESSALQNAVLGASKDLIN